MNSVFFVDRVILAVLALACSIIGLLVSPISASAAEDMTTQYYSADYDRNTNGIIDFGDIDSIKSDLVTSQHSVYGVTDLVCANRIMRTSAANATAPAPSKSVKNGKVFYVNDLTVSKDNDWFFINFLMSDFTMSVEDCVNTINFNFYENGVASYTILWDKTVNVVCNNNRGYDYLISVDCENIHYEVFRYDNQYFLNICKPDIGTALSLYNFVAEDAFATQIDLDFITDLFSSNYFIENCKEFADYDELMFMSSEGTAEVIIRVPLLNDNELLNPTLLASCEKNGETYSIYVSPKTSTTYDVYVKVN